MARSFSGRRLRKTRKAAGVSVERLALSIGRTSYSIHEYELGRVTPPINVLAAIADIIGSSVDDLLDEEEAHAA
ncbi:helix-turn-helix domain-containing protein [Streptomyces albicerus]|uniref:helix-turn-helix domain-containing protein n=1 Tax=Streptomyces albicerus TaxID=2569859 RepID=UPI00124B8359|nr:helix-turn-helix transcriptional regulator [Streptomyces albicerus]